MALDIFVFAAWAAYTASAFFSARMARAMVGEFGTRFYRETRAYQYARKNPERTIWKRRRTESLLGGMVATGMLASVVLLWVFVTANYFFN